MKHLFKIFALILSLCMILSVSAFASGEPSQEAGGSAMSVEEAFIEYIHEWLLAENEINGNMTLEIVEDEYMPLVREFDFVTFPAEMLYGGMLEQGVPMTFEEFAAQYNPGTPSVEEAFIEYLYDYLVNVELPVNTGGLTMEIIENEFMPLIEAGNFEEAPAVLLWNGLLDSGVAMTFEEFAAQYDPAGGSAMSVEEAFIEYIHEWLLAENEINGNMTLEIVEDEYMPLVREFDFVTFPAEMLYGGMLEQGVPMTFEEFAAQYVPAAGGAGDTSLEAWHAYLKEYVDAVPAVDDVAYEVFCGLIDADDFTTPPADMMFNAEWWGFAAMTYDEFVAAGGVYEIPAFDPGLTPD